MQAAEILNELHRRGVELRAVGDRIRFKPVAAVPPELLTEMREHKPEIISLLADPCPSCGGAEGTILCRRCGIGVEAADAFLAGVPAEVRQAPVDSTDPVAFRRPEWEGRCERCCDLFMRGVTVLACSRCDVRRKPSGRRGGPGRAA